MEIQYSTSPSTGQACLGCRAEIQRGEVVYHVITPKPANLCSACWAEQSAKVRAFGHTLVRAESVESPMSAAGMCSVCGDAIRVRTGVHRNGRAAHYDRGVCARVIAARQQRADETAKNLLDAI